MSVPAEFMCVAKRGRVLVIDDEPLIVETLKRILRRDHDVAGSSSPADSLSRILGGERFDAILCDVMMPKLTGMDVHAALSRYCPAQAERLVFVTGGAITEEDERFLHASGNRRLAKPFSAEAVLDVVRILVG